MTITELIKALESIKEQKGDLPIKIKFIMPGFKHYNRPIMLVAWHDGAKEIYLTATDSKETEEKIHETFGDGPIVTAYIEDNK